MRRGIRCTNKNLIMKSLLILLSVSVFLAGCRSPDVTNSSSIIATGQMPAVARDHSNNLHLVYGKGDSILYSYSSDHGKTFSTPALISVVQKLAASHMRGPQIAATNGGLSV